MRGPLTATRLCAFADQPVRLVGRMNGDKCALRAERADGVVAMSATAVF